jgi:hypothetical protein
MGSQSHEERNRNSGYNLNSALQRSQTGNEASRGLAHEKIAAEWRSKRCGEELRAGTRHCLRAEKEEKKMPEE